MQKLQYKNKENSNKKDCLLAINCSSDTPSCYTRMEQDVVDLPSTSNNSSARPLGNDTKRKRLDALTTQTDIDISRLGFDPNNQNRFAALAGLNIEGVPHPTNSKKKKPDAATPVESTHTKPQLCPPIFLFDANIKSIVEQLEAMTPKIYFKIKNINKYKSKLYFADPHIHTEMLKLLRENTNNKNPVKAHSFTPKEKKQISLVIRGFYQGIDPDVVKKALDKAVPETVDKVSKFITPYTIKKNIETGLILVKLLPGKTLKDVSQIKYLLSQTVTWEKPNKKQKEIQCHRCQRWGHIAKNCGSEFNCVKCDQKHLPGECQREKTETSNPHCVNCGENGHPANWKGCPAYKKYVANKNERIQKARELREVAAANVKRSIHPSFSLPGKTFANLFQPQHAQQLKPSIVDEFLKLTNYFLEPEELTLEQEINIFLANFQNMPKNDAKEEFLRILKKVKTSYGP